MILLKYKKDYFFPNLFIPGAGKSGTSTLHELLNTHPEVCMSSTKEPHFWTWPQFDSFSDKEFENYLALFKERDILYLGESSTGYLCFPNFIERIQRYYKIPPKFIFILRNPIDRIYSHYWWLRGIGSEDLSFEQAILKDFNIEPSEKYRLPEANFKHYYQFGLYGKWIKRFYTAFGKDSIHVITTESLKNKKLKTLNSCFEFLNIDWVEDIPEIHTNKTTLLRFPKLYKYAKKITWGDYKIKKVIKPFFPQSIRSSINKSLYNTIYKLTATQKTYPPLNEKQRLWLKELYQKDVALLKKLTEKDFSEWKDF